MVYVKNTGENYQHHWCAQEDQCHRKHQNDNGWKLFLSFYESSGNSFIQKYLEKWVNKFILFTNYLDQKVSN